MISQFFITLGTSLMTWMASLFPAWDPPGWMTNTPQMLRDLLESFQGLGVWVDWVALGICCSAVIGVYVVGFTTKFVRTIVAHLPMIGGRG